MSTYGDRGNALCLKQRCQWRGIRLYLQNITLETRLERKPKFDILLMGGAQDRQQKLAVEDLRKNKGEILRELIEAGTAGLFVCAAYQFLGHYYRPAEGEDLPGLGIFDLYTHHPGQSSPRCIGNIAVDISTSKLEISERYRSLSWPASPRTLVGFENHGGRTFLGKKVVPLGGVLKGFGNNGQDKTEGAVYKNALGSYLHGPLLPKNPHLADYLISKALEKKYNEPVSLPSLDDALEWQAHKRALQLCHLH